jgi:hypothetical protein
MEWIVNMSQAVAQYLASSDPEYRARKLHGKWCVWCDASDHVVEFEPRTVAAAELAVYSRSCC